MKGRSYLILGRFQRYTPSSEKFVLEESRVETGKKLPLVTPPWFGYAIELQRQCKGERYRWYLL